MTLRSAPALFGVLPLAAALASCGVNSVPTAEETAKARWADVQNQYQRRADLIPNLVATVRAAGAQEKSILVEVTQARAAANQITVAPGQLTDPAALQRYAAAQTNVGVSLQRLQEAYPQLQSQQGYRDLTVSLEGTENRIAQARRDYNLAVQAYNTTIRTFPNAIGAKVVYGARPMVPFQAVTPGADTAPTVNFGNGN
ncbi:LemA family protein [Sphingomonas sp.]|uniref:LemA family protein n=1 Tax=Sphingomonas sp. TaxID=28214 RepID=UPI003CC64455